MDTCRVSLSHSRAWSLTKLSPSPHRCPKRHKMSVSITLPPPSSPTSLISCHVQNVTSGMEHITSVCRPCPKAAWLPRAPRFSLGEPG